VSRDLALPDNGTAVQPEEDRNSRFKHYTLRIGHFHLAQAGYIPTHFHGLN
jgi:hypothetical protein